MAYDLNNSASRSAVLAALGYAPQECKLCAILQSNEQGNTAPGPGDPPGVDYSTDLQDPRIVEFDVGRGPELLADPTFSAGTNGFSASGSTTSVSGGVLTVTKNGSAGSNPSISQALTGLEIGATYEVTFEVSAFLNTFLVGLGAPTATSVIVSTRRTAAAAMGMRRVWRARFVATSPTHTLTGASEGSVAANAKWLECSYFSMKKVLTTGISYPIALETTSPYKDPASFAAMGTNPNMTMARELLRTGKASRVTQLNHAIGGAGLVGDKWDPTDPGELYTPFIAALTALQADNPVGRVVVTAFGGEWDATVGATSVDEYVNTWGALAKGIRAVPGCADALILVNTLIPEYAASNTDVFRIVSAQRRLAAAIPNLKLIETPTGVQKLGEAFHINANGARAVGALRAEAVPF